MKQDYSRFDIYGIPLVYDANTDSFNLSAFNTYYNLSPGLDKIDIIINETHECFDRRAHDGIWAKYAYVLKLKGVVFAPILNKMMESIESVRTSTDPIDISHYETESDSDKKGQVLESKEDVKDNDLKDNDLSFEDKQEDACSTELNLLECKAFSELRGMYENENDIDKVSVIDAIENTRDNILILGNAGSGKSTFLRTIRKLMKNVMVLAPTGIAAINANGATIHSGIGVPVKPYVPMILNGEFVNMSSVFKDRAKLLRKIDTIIIDEISMVRPDLLDNVADILRVARRSDKPFGGVRMIMIGDLGQLPPVVKDDKMLYGFYDSRYFFSSKALLASGFKVFKFERIYRQNDVRFVNMLNEIRDGKLSEDNISLIKDRMGLTPNPDCVTICSTNKEASDINSYYMERLSGKAVRYDAIMEDDFPKDAPCEINLTLKKKAKVVLTKNGEGFVNGSTGEVMDLLDHIIRVRLNDGHIVEVSPNTWVKERYTLNGRQVETISLGAITQFPIRLGYAITSHKSQGMTIDNVIIDMGRSFEYGQIYTALSRCRSLDGLFIKTDITKKILPPEKAISDFNDYLEKNGWELKPLDISLLHKKINVFSDEKEN